MVSACLVVCMSAIMWVGPHAFSANAASSPCEAIEIVEGNDRYNRLVCEGLTNLEREKYKEAIADFEEALGLSLFEAPNFKLLSRLALVYHLSGDTQRARSTLAKSELALMVLTGVAKCREHPEGFMLVKSAGDSLDAALQSEVALRMCGAAYDYYYVRTSLGQVLADAKLIEHYRLIAKKINKQR